MRIAALLIAMCFASQAVAGMDEGIAAYKKHDYATTLVELAPLAEQGNLSAQDILGLMYLLGQGIPKDEAKGVQLITASAEGGFADAQFNLGAMFENGHGVEKDLAAALAWYTKSAEQGYAAAQGNLGMMYANARGVDQDDEVAVEWYAKAAEQDYAVAQRLLGAMYLLGRGVEQDDDLAFEWTNKAAAQNDEFALAILGEMYENGNGTEKDLAKAEHYYTLASKTGNELARKALGRLQASKNCVAKATTFLFNEAVMCTNKDTLRAAIQEGGAVVEREDDGYWYDIYDSSEILEGTSKLSVSYIKDKFARAFYEYDADMDTAKVVEVRDMVASKYGKPATSSGNPAVGEVRYTWKLKDGIQLEVNRGWPDTTVYLTYTHPANFAALEAEQERQKHAAEVEKRGKQNRAF
ncbi:MAG: tetratricopeptide repeat protein [Sideroxydans sp.]|nr:tetratricopeptide repeat protein [Sideroxydans sp.]